ncbi:hypothetical protein B1A_02366, partial [mine drainage metagenome]
AIELSQPSESPSLEKEPSEHHPVPTPATLSAPESEEALPKEKLPADKQKSSEETIQTPPPPSPPAPINQSSDLLPRIPVEAWTDSPVGEGTSRTAPPQLTAAEKEKALKDRAAAGDKKGKAVKGAKEKNQKLDRLHLLREEDFVDLDDVGEGGPAKPPAAVTPPFAPSFPDFLPKLLRPVDPLFPVQPSR